MKLTRSRWIVTALLLFACSARAQSPRLGEAAKFVRAEVSWWSGNPPLAPEYLHALSAMNYVQGRLLPANYQILKRDKKLPAVFGPEQCLALQAGLCGNQVQTTCAILKRSLPGIKRRSVEFYLHDEPHNANRNHVTLEVFYAGGWHYFDVTTGTVFRAPGAKRPDEVLSIEQIRAIAKAGGDWRSLAVTNDNNPWVQAVRYAGADPFEPIAWPDTDLLVARSGTLHLRPRADGSGFDIRDLQNVLGFSADYADNIGNVKYTIDPTALGPGKSMLELTFGSCDPADDARLVVSDAAAKPMRRLRSSRLEASPSTSRYPPGQVPF